MVWFCWVYALGSYGLKSNHAVFFSELLWTDGWGLYHKIHDSYLISHGESDDLVCFGTTHRRIEKTTFALDLGAFPSHAVHTFFF